MSDSQGQGVHSNQILAPLKRNHACKECKKRKTKCDGNKPSCTPCLRSHAHAIRSANRNGTTLPILVCTWTDSGLSETIPPIQEQDIPSRTGYSSGIKRAAVSQGRRTTKDEENDALKLKIAQLEAKLAIIGDQSRNIDARELPKPTSARSDDIVNHWVTEINNCLVPNSNKFGTLSSTEQSFERSLRFESVAGNPYDKPFARPAQNNDPGFGPNDSFPDNLGFDDFFVIPVNWPRGLPSPFLLEHLIETFFSSVPQVSRMLHRSTLLARIKLPPVSSSFPFPGLLHAICAAASSHTAWVNNLSPDQIESAVQRHVAAGLDLSTIADFGLSQAEMANRTIDFMLSTCMMGNGDLIIQVTQTCILLGDVYLNKGFPLKSWMINAQPARLINSLELNYRNPRINYKEPLLPPAQNDLERESRLVTLWMAFINDAGFTISSTWTPSMPLGDIKRNLPTTLEEWEKTGTMLVNPQDPDSENLFTDHPVHDFFVLAVKTSLLLSEVACFLRTWRQRKIQPKDETTGPSTQAFKDIVRHIEGFMTTVPSVLKNVLKSIDTSNHSGFDVNLLAIHIFPNLAMAILHQDFIKWEQSDPSMMAVLKACEAVLGLLHLIPSNLDVTVIFTPLMTFSLYNIGRIMADFVRYASTTGQHNSAICYRADLATVQNLLDRYGQRHPLGNIMSHFLGTYVHHKGDKPISAHESCLEYSRKLTNLSEVSSCSINPDGGFSTTTPPNLGAESSSSRLYMSSGQSMNESRVSDKSPAITTPSRTNSVYEPSASVIESIEKNTFDDNDGLIWGDWGSDAIKVMGVNGDL
ncbi:uncharacterized protein L203_104320 [Cryptococcus depauperatus CBS 7841]|uniref:Zn(2)-C6 fungal-type domain-containing protein n=1 Tax=Cryptococcus depauperatus CBS 7841 TaxID=1295531 RepID=A0AAJ8JVI7_9TREE